MNTLKRSNLPLLLAICCLALLMLPATAFAQAAPVHADPAPDRSSNRNPTSDRSTPAAHYRATAADHRAAAADRHPAGTHRRSHDRSRHGRQPAARPGQRPLPARNLCDGSRQRA
jgi:hypothetical protein